LNLIDALHRPALWANLIDVAAKAGAANGAACGTLVETI
jgi:hypothetical protein